MVNDTASGCKNCMFLLRLIVLEGMIHNMKICVKHVSSKDNGKADAISRLQWDRFVELSNGKMNVTPEAIPEIIWPVEKIWMN